MAGEPTNLSRVLGDAAEGHAIDAEDNGLNRKTRYKRGFDSLDSQGERRLVSSLVAQPGERQARAGRVIDSTYGMCMRLNPVA